MVGTKRQAKDVVRDAARSIGMPYVSERWLGGTLTNNETIRSSVRRLDDIEAEMARPEYQRQSKKVQAVGPVSVVVSCVTSKVFAI